MVGARDLVSLEGVGSSRPREGGVAGSSTLGDMTPVVPGNLIVGPLPVRGTKVGVGFLSFSELESVRGWWPEPESVEPERDLVELERDCMGESRLELEVEPTLVA